MVCTSKIREYPSRDPAFPLESRHSLKSPVRKRSGYGINRYMERFLLRMLLTHSGPAPLPSIWNGSLYFKPFRFFTHAGCRFRITRVWNASFMLQSFLEWFKISAAIQIVTYSCSYILGQLTGCSGWLEVKALAHIHVVACSNFTNHYEMEF